jgi:hypothetical protein
LRNVTPDAWLPTTVQAVRKYYGEAGQGKSQEKILELPDVSDARSRERGIKKAARKKIVSENRNSENSNETNERSRY